MNYPAYGAPPVMGLPYPANQLMSQPMQIVPGQPPVLPNVPVPQPLQPYYPLIVSASMDAIQAKATANPLRVFTYNQMSANGWNNPDFAQHVELLVRLIDMKMAQRQFADIQQAIIACATYAAELETGLNVQRYDALLQGMDPQTLHAVQQVIQQARATSGEINMHYQRMAQQGMGGQFPQNPPMQPVGYGQPAGYGPAPGRAVDWRQAQQAQNLAQSGVGAVSTAGGGYGSAAYTSNDPMARRFEGRAQAAPRPGPTTHAQNIQEVQRPTHQPRPAVARMPGAAATPVTTQQGQELLATAPGVRWVPSVKSPVTVAYDPLSTTLRYLVTPDGLQPVTRKKADSDMDINKHLTSPSFASVQPTGVETLDTRARVFETEASLQEDKLKAAAAEPSRLQVQYKDQAFRADISIEDLWLHNEAQLATMRKLANRTSVHRSCDVHLIPLLTRTNPRSMINAISQAPSFEAACKAMNGFLERLKKGETDFGDEKALSFINKRLTQRLNNFLKKELAVSSGWVDSFMEDAPAVPQFLSNKYGAAFGQKLAEYQSEIISQALQVVDDDYAASENTNLFAESELEEMKKAITVTYFYDYVTLTSLDLYSNELRFDLPPTDVAVGVFASQTPLLHSIADNILTHERSLQLKFARHLIRTADGVTLQVMASPMREDFILICPEDL